MRQLPVSFSVALGLGFILPLLNYFRDPPMGDFFGEWSSALVMALGALFMLRALPSRLTVNGALLAVPVLIAVLIGVQAGLGRDVYVTDAFLYLCYLGMFALVVLLGQHFRADGLAVEVTQRMAWAMVLVALVNVAAQFAQLGRWDLQLQPWVVKLRVDSICIVYGNTGQSNQTSSIAWLAILGSLYLAHERRMPMWLLPLLVLLFMFSSAVTASRMAWLFLALTVSLTMVARPRWEKGVGGNALLAGALVLAFVVVNLGVAALMGVLEPTCKGSVARLAEGQEAGISARLDYLRQALIVWSASPWIGSGALSFSGMTYRLVDVGQVQPLDTYSHNLVAQLLAEFGLAGALAVLVPLAACVFVLWRRRRELRADDALLVAWLGVLGIHSMLEFPLWYVHFLMFFGLALGLLIRPLWLGFAPVVPIQLLVGMLAISALVVCGALIKDYRSLDRLQFLVMTKVSNNIASSPQIDALLGGADADILIFRPHADHLTGVAMAMNKEDLRNKIAATERLLARSPTAVSVARRIVLAVIEDDLATARYHLDRLYMFFPGPAIELTEQMRSMATKRPDELSRLARLIDEAAADAPRGRR